MILYFWIYYRLAVLFWKNHFTSLKSTLLIFAVKRFDWMNFPVHFPSKSCVVQTITLCVGLEADNTTND